MVSGGIRFSGSYIIEENNPILLAKRRHDVSPHVLITPKTMGKNHRFPALVADNLNIVS